MATRHLGRCQKCELRRARRPGEPLRKAASVWLRDQFPKLDADSVGCLADDVAQHADHDATWEAAEPLTIARGRQVEWRGRAVRVAGHLGGVRVREVVQVPGTQERIETTRVALLGTDNETIETLDILGEAMVDDVEDLLRAEATVELLGVVVAVPSSISKRGSATRWRLMLHVVGVRQASSALDFVGAADQERRQASADLDGLHAAGTRPLDHMMEVEVAGLGIEGRGESPDLVAGLLAVNLQALSSDRLDCVSGRLSILCIGRPGCGKGLLAELARTIGLSGSHVSAAHLSIPGLVGASHSTRGGRRCEPGVLVRASRGVVTIEDAHTMKDDVLERLSGELQRVLEDGAAVTSVRGGRAFSATPALFFDANRREHLGGAGPEFRVLTHRALLSRIDVPIEFARDGLRTCEIASRLVGGERRSEAPPVCARRSSSPELPTPPNSQSATRHKSPATTSRGPCSPPGHFKFATRYKWLPVRRRLQTPGGLRTKEKQRFATR